MEEKTIVYVTTSVSPYKHNKLTVTEKQNMHFSYQSMTLRAFINKIKDGYFWKNNAMSPDCNSTGSFVSTQCVVYELETVYELHEYVDKMAEKKLPIPTFAYTIGGNRGIRKLKLVYVFNRPLVRDEFAVMHTNIASAINIKIEDKHFSKALSKINCGCPEYSMFVRQNVFTMDGFPDK